MVAHHKRFEIHDRQGESRPLQKIARLPERQEGNDPRMDAARDRVFGLIEGSPQLAQRLLAQGDGEEKAVRSQHPPGFRQHRRRVIGPVKQHARYHEIQAVIGKRQSGIVAHETGPAGEPLGRQVGMDHRFSRHGEGAHDPHHQRPPPASAMIGEAFGKQTLGRLVQKEAVGIPVARRMPGASTPQKSAIEQLVGHPYPSIFPVLICRPASGRLTMQPARLHLAGREEMMQKLLRYGTAIAIAILLRAMPAQAAGSMGETALAGASAGGAESRPLAPAALDAKGLFAVKTTVAAVDLYTPAAPMQSRRVGELVFLSGLQIHGHDERFGGFSGFVLDSRGRTLLAVSDNGFWMRAELQRDRTGIPRGLGSVVMGPIRDFRGDSLTPAGEDAEALAPLSGRLGPRLLVAFEHWHRLWTYPVGTHGPPFLATMVAMAEPLRVPKMVLRHPANRGIEAAVELHPGRLLLFSEGASAPHHGGNALQAWLVDISSGSGSGQGAERAQALALQPFEEGFAPTAAALWPGCCVILLERRYRVMTGVEAAVLAIPLGRIRPGALLKGRVLGRLAAPVTVDNFEGLWVETNPDGRARILLMSDDNYRRSQRTLLMTFLWANAPRLKPSSD